MIKEKNRIAILSVFAAIFQTGFKLIIGLKKRSSDAGKFVEVCIHLEPGLSIEEPHKISHHVADEIKKMLIWPRYIFIPSPKTQLY